MSDFSFDTLFLLGAGASSVYGYPTGYELRNEIIDSCVNKQGVIYSVLQQLGWPDKAIYQFGLDFRSSIRDSIDYFLTHRQDYREIAKNAIAIKIANHETKLGLHYPIRGNWIQYLINNYLGRSKDNFFSKKVNFLTFNYDRSLEMILFEAIKSTFNLQNAEVKQIMNKVYIEHLYGKLGEIHDVSNGKLVAPFGHIGSGSSLIKDVSNEIKVLTEEREKFDATLKDYFYYSEKIFILGFGFDEMNLERLDIDWNKVPGRIFATTLGKSDVEIGKIKRNMKLTNKEVHFVNQDCELILKNNLY